MASYATKYLKLNTTVLNSWIFQVESGYNKLSLTQPVSVLKGSMIKLLQNTGRVAIDQSGAALYSDVELQSSVLNKLNTTSNWRFYLKATTDLYLYKFNIDLSYSYAFSGSYSLSLEEANSNSVFQHPINVPECILIFKKIKI